MSIDKFITDILNIKLKNVLKIDSIPQSDNSIKVKVRLKPCPNIICPICLKNDKITVHGYATRKLIHSTLMNRNCIILYEQRRYNCKKCEFTFKEKNPFINTRENVTYETIVNVLLDLKFVNMTYTLVAKRHHLSPTKVMRIFDKHVQIDRKPLPKVLSIDEHYFPESNYDSLYYCLLMNFETGELIDVLPDRKKDYLVSYFGNIRNKTLKDDGTSDSNAKLIYETFKN